MNRIDEKFDLLKKENKKAMIPFITAGDPNAEMTYKLVLAMEKAGADIVELGIPYSDPLADGPVIQSSSLRALKNGTNVKNVMEIVRSIRKISSVPIVFLMYYNCIFKYGTEEFLKASSDAGVDGIIIPDLPIEERKDILKTADKYNIYLIPLVAPNSNDRIKAITENGKGFIYCISSNGTTGVRHKLNTDIKKYMDTVSGYSNLPKAIGFGISGPDMADKIKQYCDGVIVGSAIVKIIANAESDEKVIESVKKFISDIKHVL